MSFRSKAPRCSMYRVFRIAMFDYYQMVTCVSRFASPHHVSANPIAFLDKGLLLIQLGARENSQGFRCQWRSTNFSCHKKLQSLKQHETPLFCWLRYAQVNISKSDPSDPPDSKAPGGYLHLHPCFNQLWLELG